MRLASYKTERGAAKYAREIERIFPQRRATPVLLPDASFRYGVLVDGKAYAARRPRNYGRDHAR